MMMLIAVVCALVSVLSLWIYMEIELKKLRNEMETRLSALSDAAQMRFGQLESEQQRLEESLVETVTSQTGAKQRGMAVDVWSFKALHSKVDLLATALGFSYVPAEQEQAVKPAAFVKARSKKNKT